MGRRPLRLLRSGGWKEARMVVLLNVPDDIGEKLEARWADLSKQALEALAAEAYREGILTAFEVQRTLGLSSRWDTDEVLKRAGALLDYSEDDLQQDIATYRRLSSR
jgi:predicted HTH domain antitoxin